MKRTRLVKGAACVTLFVTSALALPGQTGPVQETSSTATAGNAADETIVLSPFVVESAADEGYAARYTLAGTRIRTDIKDVGSSISIVTGKFLQDTGTTNAAQLLVYTQSTEVGAPGGNFLNIGDNDKAGAINYGTTRVRGLTSADNTRDFYLTDIPWDSYNTGRIDIQRGPNSILFGIGSPAGIINASLNHATYKNSYTVENRLDNFGSLRFSGDFNQVIIPQQLAFRFSLLDDHTKFQQEPAFRRDRRLYAALRYDPAIFNRGAVKTTFEANMEQGSIRQNLPRPSPPNDYLTPWFLLSDARQQTGFRFKDGVSNDSNPEGYFLQGAGGILNSGGTIAAYYQGQYTGLAFPHNQTGNAYYRGIADLGTVTNYKSKGVIPGAAINAWKSTTLRDPSIFDFRHTLLDGNTKAEDSTFRTLNLALRQEFMDGTFGYELAFDYQKSNPSGHTFLGTAGYGIVVDVMGTLAGSQNGGIDDLANPNLGKPFVIGGTNSSWNWQHLTKRTGRLTMFYDLDFRKITGKDSKLGWILGDNQFTGLLSRYEADTYQYFSGSDYLLAEPGRTELAEGGRLYILDYLSQTKLTGHNPAGIHLPGITGYPVLQSGTRANRDTLDVPYSQVPFTPYTEWQLAPENRTYYGSPTLIRKTVDTAAIVWQGHWLDGTLVPLLAFRRDLAYQQQGGYQLDDGTFHEGAPSTSIRDANGDDITTYNPFDPRYRLGPKSAKSGVNSRTFSVVTHTPRRWREKLPGNLDFQLIYNQSENFQPSPGRTDILNRPLPDPSGKTKEYGVAISAFDDRLYLKIAHYKTEQKDVEISEFRAADGSNVAGIGLAEVWARSAAKIHSGQAYGAVGPAISDTSWGFVADTIYGYSSDGHAITFKPYGPWAESLGPSVVGSAPTVWDGRGNGSKAYNGGSEPYPTGTVRQSYTQAELDATWAIEKAAIDAVLNNPPSDAFLTAMGLDHDTFFDGTNPNYFPTQSHSPSGEITGTTESEGTEIELLAQPIKGLSISANVTRTSAKRTSLAQSFVDYVAERRVFFENGPAGDMRIWSSGWADTQIDPYNDAGNANMSVTFENHVNSPVAKFLAATNTNVPELHPWAFNLVVNYDLPEHLAKGFSVGGGYRWQDRLVTGYPITTDANGFETYDLAHPYKGKAQTAIDLWVGYQRRFTLGPRKMNWRIRLNARNVFGSDSLIVSSVEPDGRPAAYRIPEPTTVMVTNTFEF